MKTETFRARLCLTACILAAAIGAPTSAQTSGADMGTKADAEKSIQAYLAMWSSDRGVTQQAVERFYAPTVVYYGKRMSRDAVYADKQAYIRNWPSRSYHEVPGTLQARCNGDRSLCHVTVDMEWRRVSRRGVQSTGRATLGFDFVPADGARKIARESARIAGSGSRHRG